MYALRTLDVWDTLLRRCCHPDFVKLAMSRHLLLRWHGRLRRAYRDHWSIFRERCLIEGELARTAAAGGGDDEYTLHQVIGQLVARVLDMPAGEAPAAVSALIAAEVEFEKASTFADPECRRYLADFPARQSIFLSDFYMPAATLAQLLDHHGLGDLAPTGLSSCDVGLNKRSGKLYRHVHALYGVSPDEHVHIGDNLHSDLAVPAALGVHSVHYLPDTAHCERQQRELLFPDRGTLFNHIDRTIADDADQALPASPGPARAAFLLGTRCAPMFVGYALFIAERAIIDGLDRLLFLTREGEFFLRLYRAVLPAERLAGLPLPPASLIEVSRLATFCASLQEISTGEMMRLWNLYSTQSMEALARSLGIDPSRIEPACARHGIAIAAPITHPWLDERVQRLFTDAEFRAVIQEQIAATRGLLLDYLDRHGLDGGADQVGIVDIGWRGTIQDNIALLLPSRAFHGYYLGLARVLNRQPGNCRKAAYGPDLNASLDNSHFLDAVSPIEMLCNSPGGSTTGYERAADRAVHARRHVDPDENDVHESFARHFQDGVLQAAAHWGRYVDSHAISAAELRERACQIWDRLLRQSPQELSDAYAALHHNEVFGVGTFVDKSAVPSPATMFRGILWREERQEVILYLKQTQWPAGLWKRRDLSLVHRAMLSAALTGGRVYKRLRQRFRRGRA